MAGMLAHGWLTVQMTHKVTNNVNFTQGTYFMPLRPVS
jgi:hypothetical protein